MWYKKNRADDHGDHANYKHGAGSDIFNGRGERMIFLGTKINQIFQGRIRHLGKKNKSDQQKQNTKFRSGKIKNQTEQKSETAYTAMDAEITFMAKAITDPLEGVTEAIF